MALVGFPSGYRFLPTDQELLYYLFKKVKDGGSLSPTEAMYIPDCNLYGKQEPWQLFDEFGPKYIPFYGFDDLYFFTKLNKKSNGSNIVRRVGVTGGTWHGEDRGRKIVAEVEINEKWVDIEGVMKRFKYKNKNSNQNCGWIMHEFSLPEFNSEIVLCRIRKSEPRVAVRVRAACNGESAIKRRKVEFEIVSVESELKNPESPSVESELKNIPELKEEDVDDFIESLLKNTESPNMELEFNNSTYDGLNSNSDTEYYNGENLSMDGTRDQDLDAFIQSLLV